MTNYSAQGIVLVKRKPATADEAVLNQKVSVITAEKMKSGKVSDFTQLFKDLDTAGIFVNSDGNITLRGNVKVVNGSTTVALFTDGKLNANLINAETITVNHLYAKSAQNGSVVGHFGNYDKSDAVAGDDKCPLWLGATTAANAPFRVTKDGKLYSVAGTIGGFDIGSNSIGSTAFEPFKTSGKDPRYKMYMTDEFIQFQNNNGYNGNLVSKFNAVIGTEAASSIPHRLFNLTAEMESVDSLSAAAYINVKNHSGSVNSITTRTGLLIDVTGGGYNNALYAKNGNVLVNGVNAGIKYSCLYLTSTNMAYSSSELNVKDNNVWFVECRATGTKLVLPTLKSVRAALNIGETDIFSIRLTVIAARTCTESFDLYGRRSGYSYGSTDYPLFLNNSASNDDHWGMSAGDVCEVQLTFDGSLYFAQLLVLNR